MLAAELPKSVEATASINPSLDIGARLAAKRRCFNKSGLSTRAFRLNIGFS